MCGVEPTSIELCPLLFHMRIYACFDVRLYVISAMNISFNNAESPFYLLLFIHWIILELNKPILWIVFFFYRTWVNEYLLIVQNNEKWIHYVSDLVKNTYFVEKDYYCLCGDDENDDNKRSTLPWLQFHERKITLKQHNSFLKHYNNITDDTKEKEKNALRMEKLLQ